MSIDPGELVQAGPPLYEVSSGDNTTTYIPTTSAGSVGFMVMSYPGRPPMVPGMPPMPPTMGMQYMQLGGHPQLMPTVMSMPPHMIPGPPLPPMPPMRQFRPHPNHNMHHNNSGGGGGGGNIRPNSFTKRQQEPPGPPVTVFVGNITERAPDAMIRHILSACGHVVSWKRVQAFGFCEFGSPDSGLRAIRLLHDMQVGDKQLVVKVDAKTKTVLDEYKAERRRKLKGRSPLQDETPDEEDYMDDMMKHTDKMAIDRIMLTMEDYESDMTNFSSPSQTRRQRGDSEDRKISRTQEKLIKLSQAQGEQQDPPPSDASVLEDVDIEEGKRDLITREIGKFREIMKKQEEEKEVERKRKEVEEKDREKRHKEREKERAARSQSRGSGSKSRSRSPTHSPSPESLFSNKIRAKTRERRRSHSRDREREREQREREQREKERERERERDRDRERERERERERDREREDVQKKSERELARDREEEEESKERKKADRKAREKEAAYQERLRNWESRERRKNKEYDKEKERQRLKEDEQEREAKKLKEFLEDYDDERDDTKFYKGRELQRRLGEREKEIEQDGRDRQREKEELEELRNKIFSEEHEDPSAEFEKLKQAHDELYKPKILINVNLEHARQREREREREHERERERERLRLELEEEREREQERERERLADLERESNTPHPPEPSSPAEPQYTAEGPHSPAVSEADSDRQASPGSPAPQPLTEEDSRASAMSSGGEDRDRTVNNKVWNSPQTQHVAPPAGKKKKLDVKEVFNTDDDEDSNLGSGKKRKLVPLDYGEDKRKKEEKKEEVAKSQEEKRKHIKTLIDKIPTDKNALFAFQLDWAAVDNQLMERRIRPWINKKIIEYIGEPEPTLVDFICSKVLAGSAPQGILDDVQMVLDEEAEVFVVKMWRLLIYEIEAKKLGLVK